MFTEIPFPDFDPVLLDVGFFQVRWYGMAYLGGVVLGWLYLLRLNAEKYWPEGAPLSREDVEDLMVWSIVGIVIGGRLGYVFFYQPSVYMNDPMEILAIWHGGMSFHGGLLGVCTAVIGFAHFRERPIWSIADVFGCTAPIGLLLGRIANFVNGELYGRVYCCSSSYAFYLSAQTCDTNQVLWEASSLSDTAHLASSLNISVNPIHSWACCG